MSDRSLDVARVDPPARGLRRAPRASGAFGLRGPLSTAGFLGVASGTFVTLFGLWTIATSQEWVDPLFVPSPADVWNRMSELSSQGTLWDDVLISAYRISVGFVLATLIAIPMGVLMGAYRIWEAACEPLIDFIRYMPVVAFVPLSIIWAGTADTQKFLIIFIGTFFQQTLMVMDGVKRVPQPLIDVGKTLGMPDRRVLRRIVVPASAPVIWDSMRITLGWAWTYLTLAELVAADSGLGYRITVGQRFFQTDLIFGYILLLGALGLVTDQLMKASGRHLFGWSREGR
jgi:NitT/TauT family transport system permease protein